MTSASKLPEHQAAQVYTSESMEASDNGPDSITVGLVPSPGLPVNIANDIRDDLARDLGESVNSDVRWVVPDPITGSNVETPDLLEELGNLAQADAWDYTIALTDLPLRRNDKIVIADASTDQRAGWISIPALGPFRLRHKVRRITVQLVEDLYVAPNEEDIENDDLVQAEEAGHGDTSDAAETIDTRYISKSRLATVHLLTGMVYANEPWTIFPSFKTTTALRRRLAVSHHAL